MKKTFTIIFFLATLLLLLLPFLALLQDGLTRLVMNIGAYRALQDLIVPYEIRVLGTILNLLGVKAAAGRAFIQLPIGGREEVIYLAWNCVGWQTFTLFTLTLFVGLSGAYRTVSKLEALAIGILGTYLVNIARLVLVVLVYGQFGRPFGIVFHDYFSGILTILWLFFFWWFSYSFVLEQAETVDGRKWKIADENRGWKLDKKNSTMGL